MAKPTNCLMVLLCIVLNLCSMADVQGQAPCPIKTDIEPTLSSKLKNTTVQSQAYFHPFISWNDLDQTRYSNGYATAALPSVKRTTVASFTRFGHKLQAGTEINGIRVILAGHQIGEGKLKDVSIQLRSGDITSDNLAGQYLGEYFPDSLDGSWRYGDEDQLWGVNWTADMVNSDDFGVDIQLRNVSSKAVEAFLSQVKIEVFYTEKHTLCAETCAVYFVDEQAGYNYQWKLPPGFARKSSLTEDESVNLVPMTAEFGLHEICVDAYDSSGDFAGQCCRTFYYKDCRPSYIGDYVFEDNDNSNDQSNGDTPIEGVQVSLYDDFDNLIDMTFTDEDGYYEFEIIEADKYYVQIALPEGMLAVVPDTGDEATDSDLLLIDGNYRTDILDISPGTTNYDLDFGLVRELILGDFVWEDLNYNGVQDQGESGVDSVLIYLVDEQGDTLLTTITDTLGAYRIDGLPIGTYALSFDFDDAYQATWSNQGDDDLLDSDIDETGNIALVDYREFDMPKLDIDAGLFRYASIGDYVFFDIDEDGIQSEPDTAMLGVEVSLYSIEDVLLQTTITDSLGYYLFDSLVPAKYYVSVNVSDLLRPTLENAGDDIQLDSDLMNIDGAYRTEVITIVSNEDNTSIDLGLRDNTAKLGGFVFEDMDFNGQYESIDATLVMIAIDLYDAEGNILQSTISDSLGYYLFEDILPGDYYVAYSVADNYLFTTANVGDDLTDSDVTEANGTGTTDLLTLAPGEENYDLFAGVYRLASVGDYVFVDWDENGIQSEGDTGLEGANLSLINMQGLSVGTVSSDVNGAYIFEGLTPGKYWISIAQNDLYLPALYQQGDDSALDSDLTDMLYSDTVMLMSGQMEVDLDFGFLNNYSTISGSIFEDSKADAVFNDLDTMMVNAAVWLYNADAELIASATTDAEGQFLFEDVLAGNYYLQYTLADEYVFSTDNIIDAEGNTNVFTLDPGIAFTMDDTGAYIPTSIGDYVFLDLNEDGIQSPDDEPLAGVVINLLNAQGEVVSTTESDEAGYYTFADLVPATYTLSVEENNNYLVAASLVGDADKDNNLNQDLTTDDIVICSGQEFNNIDLGFVHNYGSITGRIFEDSKADGELSAIDTLIAGAEVWLYNANGEQLAGTATDASGAFEFANVLTGDYYLLYTLPNGYSYSTTNITNANGAGSTDNFTVQPGESVNAGDTGAYRLGGLGDYVFLDQDEDGIQGDNDAPLSGVNILLINESGIVATTISDAEGTYRFGNLVPGNYVMAVEFNDLYLLTEYQEGDNNEIDSDLTSFQGQLVTDTLMVMSGMVDNAVDFGFIHNDGSITGRIFEDSKADGELSTIDTLMAGAEVWLYNANGEQLAGTTTDADGQFVFNDVLAGDYYLLFTLPNGYSYSTANITNANGAGSTDVVSLTPGGSINIGDIGAYLPAAVGDYVFLDLDENGVQNSEDESLAGIVLSLINEQGDIVSTISDENGAYGFADLTPGNYLISLEKNELYLPTEYQGGDDEALDSDLRDLLGFYVTDTLMLMSGMTDNSIDFGFVNNYATISGVVFEDKQFNSELDDQDILLNNLDIFLYAADGELVTSTTSDETGQYEFEDVLAGEYYLVYEFGEGYHFSTANITDANGAGSTNNFTADPGADIAMDDTGAYRLASIGDYVFLDNNKNGIQDEGDEPLSDILLTLSTGEESFTSISDENGFYAFDNLIPGQVYLVRVEANDNYLFTAVGQGDDKDLDSNGEVFEFELCSGEQADHYDVGFVNNFGSISGIVFTDKLFDGQFDGDDFGIEGRSVLLYNDQNVEVAATSTNEEGQYFFDEVLAGNYYIIFDASEYLVTTPNVGDDLTDSDVVNDSSAGTTAPFVVSAGQSVEGINAGLYQLGSIGDYVWFDENQNGVQDDSESGIENVTVRLMDSNNMEVATATTNAEGIYIIDNQVPGNYYIQVDYPEERTATVHLSDNDENNSDITDMNGEGTTSTFALMSGMNISTIDIGFAREGAIVTGEVWQDVDEDNIQTSADLLLSDVQVKLFDTNGEEIASGMTNSEGVYTIKPIMTGDYYISFMIGNEWITVTPNVGDEMSDSDVTNDNGLNTTETFSVLSGQLYEDVDAGVRDATSMIMGNMFVDKNADGVNMDEELLAGYTVTLFNSDDEEIATATADDMGNYSFAGVVTGDYYLQFMAPDTYIFTQANTGDDATDSDVINGLTGNTEVFSVDVQSVVKYDAGVYQLASIGDYVWLDANENGVQDTDETPVQGAVLKLINTQDNVVGTIVSDENGLYLFDQVVPGTYTIELSNDDGLIATQYQAGDDVALDSDLQNGNTMSTTEIMLMSGQMMDDIDFGLIENPGQITGTVWNDFNVDGINNDPAFTLPDVIVELYDATTNELVATLATSADYVFNNVTGGDYYIKFVAGTDYIFTAADQGADDTIDSDVTGDNGAATTATFTLTSGSSVANMDAGLITSGAIGNFVWYDENENGLQDAGELGVPMIAIDLYDEMGVLIAQDTTDLAGMYLFDEVSAGNYYLDFTHPVDIQPTTHVEDMLDINSDITGTFGVGSTNLFFVGSGENRDDIDGGFVPSGGNIVGQVWEDLIGNNIQEVPNVFVPNVTVNLYDNSDQLLSTQQTNEFGFYAFTTLAPGVYYVQVELPTGFEFVTPNIGEEDKDSEITAANGDGTTDNISIAGGAVIQNVHAGIRRLAAEEGSISGVVFEDMDADGLQNGTVPGYEGATVILYSDSGDQIATTTTDAAGRYSFTGLSAGDYYVEFSGLPQDALYSMADVGTNDAIDSDVTDFDNGRSDSFTLAANAMPTIDAGYYFNAVIGDFVWTDENENGVQDAGESGLADVTVDLIDSDDAVVSTQTTDTDGQYMFTVTPGEYKIRFTASTDYMPTMAFQGGNTALDSDGLSLGGSISETSSFELSSGESNLDWDAGFVLSQEENNAIVQGQTWIDSNANGIRETGELPIEGVQVELFTTAGVSIAQASTMSDGTYSFDQLAAGNYYVVFDNPNAAIPTLALTGGDATVDSDITGNVVDGSTNSFSLAAGEVKSNIDGGYVSTVNIGDRVWTDNNADGIQDSGEPGVANVTVNLLLSNGTVIQTDVTDASGFYGFENVPAGQFKVQFELPDGLSFTTANVGDDESDSDALADGTTELYDFTDGMSRSDIDAGTVAASSIGDQVFVDFNGNGRKSSSEPGLNGVTVRLFNADGQLLAVDVTATDPNTGVVGLYEFNSVSPGDYYITFEPPSEYLFTGANAGSDDSKDSDVTESITTGSTDIFSVASGVQITDIDAGVFLPAELGDFVWNDTNANGIQDPGESGVPNVKVSLRRSNGLELDSKFTDAQGKYCFTGLKQGLYLIAIDIPNGFVASPQNQGGDSANDSDIDATGSSALVSVAHGTSFKELDAGIHGQSNNNLISQVWFDTDENGVRDEGEVPMSNVVVMLYDEDGNVVEETETNHAGRYAFINMANGSYQIGFGLDDGFAVTSQNMGTDDMMDSDIDATGMSDMFVVNDGVSVPNIDAGLIEMTMIEELGPEVGYTDSETLTGSQFNKSTKISAKHIKSGPNPFYDRVLLQLETDPVNMRYQVIHTNGQLVASEAITERQQWVDLSTYTDGMYILVIYSNDEIVDKRYMMKIH